MQVNQRILLFILTLMLLLNTILFVEINKSYSQSSSVYFFGEPCRIPGASMEPAIMTGDWLWINKASYGAILPDQCSDIPLVNIFTWIPSLREKDLDTDWGYHRAPCFKKPQVNDLVIFNSPENKELLLVKRITKKLPRGSKLTVNTHNYDNYKKIISDEENRVELRNGSVWINGIRDSVYLLKNDFYFVLGDNSPISRDSRFFGYISGNDIVGKANLVIFSGDREKKIWQRFFRKIE